MVFTLYSLDPFFPVIFGAKVLLDCLTDLKTCMLSSVPELKALYYGIKGKWHKFKWFNQLNHLFTFHNLQKLTKYKSSFSTADNNFLFKFCLSSGIFLVRIYTVRTRLSIWTFDTVKYFPSPPHLHLQWGKLLVKYFTFTFYQHEMSVIEGKLDSFYQSTV